MLGSGFKAERLRVNLRLVINRLKLLEKKKSEYCVHHLSLHASLPPFCLFFFFFKPATSIPSRIFPTSTMESCIALQLGYMSASCI